MERSQGDGAHGRDAVPENRHRADRGHHARGWCRGCRRGFLSRRPRTLGVSLRAREPVLIHGRGIDQHISAEVAVQGIGHDYVTLFLGLPLLGVALLWARTGALRGRLLLAGVLGFFLVTYLFYLVMGMYNALFLVYTALLDAALFVREGFKDQPGSPTAGTNTALTGLPAPHRI